jgi:hypothetical protein
MLLFTPRPGNRFGVRPSGGNDKQVALAAKAAIFRLSRPSTLDW